MIFLCFMQKIVAEYVKILGFLRERIYKTKKIILKTILCLSACLSVITMSAHAELTSQDLDKIRLIIHEATLRKTIDACNAVNQQEQSVDITPQEVNALQESQKTLTDQLRKETRQLRKHTENTDAQHPHAAP